MSRSHLAQQWPEVCVRTQSLGKGGRGSENRDMNVLGKQGAEGLDTRHKPQPAVASTALQWHCWHSLNTRPTTGWVGSSLPATVLSQSARTQARGVWVLPRHSQGAACPGWLVAAGTPLKTMFPPFTSRAQRKTRFLFVPKLCLS